MNLLERITPDDVLSRMHDGLLWNTFGRVEKEISAGYIVRLCARKGGWVPFTQAELDTMHQKHGRYLWNGLDDPEWATDNGDGTYTVTERFVWACAKPALESVPV